ncbi:family 16 glycoside hydrolase [Chloroflexota bacterium]
MTSQKTARSTAWLLWTGLVLAGLIVLVLLTSGSQASQAMNSYDLETSQTNRTAGAATVLDDSAIDSAMDASFIVKKEASPGRPLHGEQVEYTVTFTNTGDVDGTLETISDTLDASLTFAGMQPSSDVVEVPTVEAGNVLVWDDDIVVGPDAPDNVVTLVYKVDTPTGEGWHFPCNSVEALADGVLVGPVETCVTVGPEFDYAYFPYIRRKFTFAWFSIEKTVTPDEILSDYTGDVTYEVVIKNEGDTTGTLLTVEDTLPTGFVYQDMGAGSDIADDPAGTSGTIVWDLGNRVMDPGDEVTLIYEVDPSSVEAEHTNSVTVTAEDANISTGSATLTIKSPILLDDNFNGGLSPDWVPFLNYHRNVEGQWYWDSEDGVGGSPGVTMDRFAVDNKDGEDGLFMYLGPDAENWTNYRLETDIILRTNSHPEGVWVRGQYEDSETRAQWVTGYYVAIGGSYDRETHYVRLLQLQTLEDCWGPPCPSSPEYKPGNEINLYNFNNPHELHEVRRDGKLTRHVWHHLDVEVEDDFIRVWLNGDFVFEYQDTKEPFLTGTVGFKTFKADTVSYDNVFVEPLD